MKILIFLNSLKTYLFWLAISTSLIIYKYTIFYFMIYYLYFIVYFFILCNLMKWVGYLVHK